MRIRKISIRNELSLCECCDGTGIDPKDESLRCSMCDGARIINHLGATFEIDKPYFNEQERLSDEFIIRTNIDSIIKHLKG
jgi:hypothetical protein